MFSRLSILICAVAVLGMYACASGAERRWEGGAGTNKWTDYANWNPNLTTLYTPDDAYRPGVTLSGTPLPEPFEIILDGDSTATIFAWQTYGQESTLTIASGSHLVVYGEEGEVWPNYSLGYEVGAPHTLNVDGTMTLISSETHSDIGCKLNIGVNDEGIMNVGATGQVWLKGTMLLRFDTRNQGTTGTLNIAAGGVFLMEGDRTGDSTLQGYLSAGRVYLDGSNTGLSLAAVEIEGETFTTFARGAPQIDPGLTIPQIPPPPPPRPDKIPHPLTAKAGWWHWYAARWSDLYRHDIVWEDGGSSMPADDGIAGTGIHARLGVVYDGDMGLKVAGLEAGIAGGDVSGTPIHDPICNTWVQGIDWAEYKWGTTLLALHNLPAGEYEIYSYHNNFDCYRRGDSRVRCDSTSVKQPNLPTIRAMALGEAPGLMEILDPGGEASGVYDHYPYRNVSGAGCGGVVMLQGAYDVAVQQVTSDSQLVPSLVRFSTDGSPVLLVYENGCCVTDTVRPGRSGGRGILNAFELKLSRYAVHATLPLPCDGADGVKRYADLSWHPLAGAASHDVYFGTDPAAVENAQIGSGQYKGSLPLGTELYDPGMLRYNTTYYWRIDEVTAEGVVKGDVWSFTTEICSVIDDFERYEHNFSRFDRIWHGAGGADVSQYLSPNSMKMIYVNVAMYGGYSEAERVFGYPRDWQAGAGRLSTLVLSFKGQATNNPDRLYVAIEDAGGSVAEAVYGSPGDLAIDAWHEWAVPLEQFAGIDLSQVVRLAVGVGEQGDPSGAGGDILIDDIAVCRGRCEPAQGPGQDLNGDCIVNFGDHAVKAQGWANTSAKWQDYRLLADQWLEEKLVWP